MFKKRKTNKTNPVKNWDKKTDAEKQVIMDKNFEEVDTHNQAIHDKDNSERKQIIDCTTKDAVKILKKSKSFINKGFSKTFFEKMKAKITIWNDKRTGIWRPNQKFIDGRWEYVDR